MYCKNCGNKIEDGKAYCLMCGKRVDNNSTNNTTYDNIINQDINLEDEIDETEKDKIIEMTIDNSNDDIKYDDILKVTPSTEKEYNENEFKKILENNNNDNNLHRTTKNGKFINAKTNQSKTKKVGIIIGVTIMSIIFLIALVILIINIVKYINENGITPKPITEIIEEKITK